MLETSQGNKHCCGALRNLQEELMISPRVDSVTGNYILDLEICKNGQGDSFMRITKCVSSRDKARAILNRVQFCPYCGKEL